MTVEPPPGMQAMVLAAGLGTRLRPLTDELPKPAVPVLNQPLASFAVEHLVRSGAEHIVLNTHHLPDALERAIASSCAPGVDMTFVHERELLGTGGGIKNAWRAIGCPETFVVMNGDILFAPDLHRALQHHVQGRATATMVLRTVAQPETYGAVEIDEQGRVRRMLGRPEQSQGLRAFMFSGVHILSARAIESLPEQGCVVRQGYRHWIDANETVLGIVDNGLWLELGTPGDYARAQIDALRGAGWSAHGVNAEQSLVAADASIDVRARVSSCVVGERCVVKGALKLDRVILWPGARIDRDLADTIVTSAGVHVPFGG